MRDPPTRPIPLTQPLDYADDDPTENGRDNEKQPKGERVTKEPSEKGLVGALIVMLPERFRPLARVMRTCAWCVAFFLLAAFGSVEWHYIELPLWLPRTASAEDLRKTDARVSALEQASAMSLRIQQRQRMMALQDIICRTGDVRLGLELEEMQYEYRRINKADYPLPSCHKSQ